MAIIPPLSTQRRPPPLPSSSISLTFSLFHSFQAIELALSTLYTLAVLVWTWLALAANIHLQLKTDLLFFNLPWSFPSLSFFLLLLLLLSLFCWPWLCLSSSIDWLFFDPPFRPPLCSSRSYPSACISPGPLTVASLVPDLLKPPGLTSYVSTVAARAGFNPARNLVLLSREPINLPRLLVK